MTDEKVVTAAQMPVTALNSKSNGKARPAGGKAPSMTSARPGVLFWVQAKSKMATASVFIFL
jgi:hypothetical protein